MITPNRFYILIGSILCIVLSPCSAVEAQPNKIPRIGLLSLANKPGVRDEAFKQGLRELGYVEGKNINIESRYTANFERLPGLAKELIGLKVDVLLASSILVAEQVKKANATIPIVVANAGNPIGSGLVASLAKPGGNVTGLYQFSPELIDKRLELLKEAVPKTVRFAFLTATDAPAAKNMFKNAREAANTLGVQFQLIEVNATDPDFESAFRTLAKERIGGLVTEGSTVINLHRAKILEYAQTNRIPAIHSDQEYAEAGGLMSYGSNRVDLYRRAAVYVDKILKGAKPGDLPMEQPTKFELVVNLKAAKQIELTIPQRVLLKADRVIK